MAGGPIGQNTGTSSGTGMPPGMAQASRDLAALGTLGTRGFMPYRPYTPQTQPPQYVDDLAHLNNLPTARPPMDSTMVDDFGSRNPSIFNPGMQGGLGQTASPFRSVLPIFTQSGQANPVFDPSSDPRLQFNTGQDYRSFMKQQRYIDDPLQRYLPMNRIGRRQFANQQYQPVAVSVGDPGRGRNSVNPRPLALANPFGMAGAGITSLLR